MNQINIRDESDQRDLGVIFVVFSLYVQRAAYICSVGLWC